MASLDQEFSSFSIDDLSLICEESGRQKVLNIKGLVEQLEITENIVSPVITGSLLVTDTFGLAKLLRTGSCFLRIKLSKTGNDDFLFEKTVRIYKQEKRKASTPNSELSIMYFCSEEFILSEQSRVSRGYNDTYTNIAKNILVDFLSIDENKIIVRGKKFLSSDFNELPEHYLTTSIQLIKIQKKIDLTNYEVLKMWEVFKTQNLTGETHYNSENKVYLHFTNWLKTQKFENGNSKTRQQTTNEALDYITSKGAELYAKLHKTNSEG